MEGEEPVDTLGYTRKLVMDMYESNLTITYGEDAGKLFTNVVERVRDKHPPDYEIPIRLSWLITVVISHASATHPIEELDPEVIFKTAHAIYHG
jgi:hypothetical protein